jgi:hypothetical protein
MLWGRLRRRGGASGVAVCGVSHMTLAEVGLQRVGGLSGGGGPVTVSAAWLVKGVGGGDRTVCGGAAGQNLNRGRV